MKLAKKWNNSNSQDEDRDLSLQNERIYVLGNEEHVKTGVVSRNESRADFLARLKGLYGQTNEPDKENIFIALSKEWNRADTTLGVTEPILQGSKFAGCSSLAGWGVCSQSKASNLHDRVQNLYEQVEQPEMEGAYMELSKMWKSQMTENPYGFQIWGYFDSRLRCATSR